MGNGPLQFLLCALVKTEQSSGRLKPSLHDRSSLHPSMDVPMKTIFYGKFRCGVKLAPMQMATVVLRKKKPRGL